MSRENEKIIAVEWRNKKPFTVFTKNHCYDIEFDKSGQGYYDCSGSGGMQGNTGGLDKLPKKVITFDDLIQHYKLMYSYCIWCPKCKDWIPEDIEYCEHITYDSENEMLLCDGEILEGY